jgi:hypothetical protein
MARDSTQTTGYGGVLPALLAGSRFGDDYDEEDIYAAYMSLLENMEGERQAGELSAQLDPFQMVEQFREQEHRPFATGVPYIFTGGSVFPQTPGQMDAERIAATGGLVSNTMDAAGSILPAILDILEARKKSKQGGTT